MVLFKSEVALKAATDAYNAKLAVATARRIVDVNALLTQGDY
jgi:hypothetical protein